jgi:hypothetical protein
MGSKRSIVYKIIPVEVSYLTKNKPGILVEVHEWHQGPFDSSLFEEMSTWCIRNSCGHRIGYDDFIFDNEQQRTMFILRWS